MIKRFDLVPVSYDSVMLESPEGEYVLHSDQEAALAEALALRALLEEAQGIIDTAETPVDDHVWSDRRRAWLAALAETEGSTK